MFEFLRECGAAYWASGLAAPGLVGWMTIAAYGAAAGFALVMAAARRQGRAERMVWIAALLVMGFMAVNKELDLQTLLLALRRCVPGPLGAEHVGMAPRVAVGFVLSCAALLATVVLWVGLRRCARRLWPTLLGVSVVMVVVALRAGEILGALPDFAAHAHIPTLRAAPEIGAAMLVVGNATVLFVARRRAACAPRGDRARGKIRHRPRP